MVSDVVVWVTDIIAFFGVDRGSGYSSCPPMGVQRNSLSKRMNINGSSLFLHSSELLQTGDMKRRPGNGIEGTMVCTSLGSLLRPLFYFLYDVSHPQSVQKV